MTAINESIPIQKITPELTYCKLEDKSSHWWKNYISKNPPFKEIKKINIKELLYQSLDNTKQHVPDGLDITVSVTDNCCFYSHPGVLQMILDQVIMNGLIFQDDSKLEKFLDIEIRLENRILFINVVDNGVGISKKDKPFIFDKFYKGSSRTEGSGIGLFMSKKYVHQLSGHIVVDSVLGVGTHCLVQIPSSFFVKGLEK